MLRKQVFDADQLAAIVNDYRNAGLTEQEVAVMAFAEKITQHAYAIKSGDVDALRSLGLSDEEILDVTLAAAARSFWSKTLDAMGTEADTEYLELEPQLRKAMQKGRPFGETAVCPHCYGTHIVKKIRAADGREEYFCPYCNTGGLLNPRNKYTEAQKLQILEHYERYSPRRIKETFGVTPATLRRWKKAKDKHTRKH